MRETTLDATGPDGNWRRRRSADRRACRRLVQSARYPQKNWTRFWGLHNLKPVAGAAVVTVGAGVAIWWIAKLLSPACGPAVLVCAIAF